MERLPGVMGQNKSNLCAVWKSVPKESFSNFIIFLIEKKSNYLTVDLYSFWDFVVVVVSIA